MGDLTGNRGDVEVGLARLRGLLAPDERLREEVARRRTAWEGSIFSAELLDVSLPDGSSSVREVARHHGGAGVCVVRDGRICLVRQWRVALAAMTLEIPAGKLDPNEDPRACAARELFEETGLTASSLELVATSVGSPGFSDETTRVFRAVGPHAPTTAGESDGAPVAHPDEGEFVDVCWVPLDVALAAVERGLITDAKTIIAIYDSVYRDGRHGAFGPRSQRM
ncbi:NUDIX hydrolase [Olsenella massiliensis]|uniref:NUDIX hydrolase n=1 Tax=Olsenella massiliensis TaxID=1622075 RepID=UPI0009E6EB27|nr:NUDIX hydrolase [Olsenella massiliensis]